MDDWDKAPVFGVRTEGKDWVVRPSAYGIVPDGHGRLAVVRTRFGTYLPGGGQEVGETPEEAVRREALEECGFAVRLGAWTVRAVQFSYSRQERAHFEKLSTFVDATIEGPGGIPREPGHEVIWADPETAARLLSHESHRWAIGQWKSRG